MVREKKSTFCRCVEIETTAFRTEQLAAARIQIQKGSTPEQTDIMSMYHLECMDMSLAIPEVSIPDDVPLAAFTFCRWFLYNAQKPEWVIEMENTKVDLTGELTRAYIFSKLHLLDQILKSGELKETVHVDHYYFIAEDHIEKQYTYSIAFSDSSSMSVLLNKYQAKWPDAFLVGVGSLCSVHREEIKTDDKNNMIIDEMSKEHGSFLRELINQNAKVYG